MKGKIYELIDNTGEGLKDHPLMKNLQKIWADNGDLLSRHYAGTDSTSSDITRKGGKTGWNEML